MKKILRIIISILYIIWGITAPVTAISAIMSFNLPALISAGVGIIMLLAGILGLFGIKPGTRRVLGIIIFIGAAVSVATSLQDGIQWQPVLSAVLAFLYIIG